MTTTAISSRTAAATSSDITVPDGSSIQVWVDATLASGEVVDIHRTDGASIDVKLVEEGQSPARLDSSKTSIAIAGPITIKLYKGVTATATAVLYDS